MTRSLCILALAWAILRPVAAPCAQEDAQMVMDQLFLSQEWQAKNNLEAARRAVQDALKLDPSDAFARIRLAQIDAASGNVRAALDGLSQVLASDSGNLLALTWRGHLQLWQGDPAAAQGDYARVLSLDPANGWACLGTAATFLARDRRREAAAYLARAQASAGDDADLHLALGDTFSRLGLTANARMELERSLELNPRGTRALVAVGEVYRRIGQEGLAQDAWRQALALDPLDARARFALLTTLSRQAERAMSRGNTVEAVRLWRTMLGYDPLNQTALERLRALPR
ncbi:tetratricopeptide repeat protein [Fundidesulfovibrio terrae]|uniref:tetratricopeptide repeat protein n=1 Tax=Fundidesulfovibrio terrae TaxID=2922866 RepID=UPI001FAEF522|nr:tetratricopeptide repeat protein [Fundidesulfovibrio terrae]